MHLVFFLMYNAVMSSRMTESGILSAAACYDTHFLDNIIKLHRCRRNKEEKIPSSPAPSYSPVSQLTDGFNSGVGPDETLNTIS